MEKIKAKAQAVVARRMLPADLEQAMKDVAYWREKLRFWQYQDKITPADAPHRPTVERKIIEITEILNLMLQDARQINRKLR